MAIDGNPPVNAVTDAGSTKEAADDPWKSGLRRDESYLIASASVWLRSENKLAFKGVYFSPCVGSANKAPRKARACARSGRPSFVVLSKGHDA